MVKELNSKNFDEFVRSETRVVIDFWATWCGPCLQFMPTFEESAKELKDKAGFGKVMVDAETELAQRFQVMSVPTLLFFKDGQQVDRVAGGLSKEELAEKIKRL
jgi:thioredoxin 1